MKILLDTHVVLWWATDSPRLTTAAAQAIRDPANLVAVSAATAWELAIKRALGRLDLPDGLFDELSSRGLTSLEITARHGLAAGSLPPLHRDPFDRMLVAQAQLEGFTIATRDEHIAAYGVPTLAA